MSGPAIKSQKDGSSLGAGFSNAATGGLASLVQAGSRAAELFPHDQEGLARVLHHRVHVAKRAMRRSGWIGGRVYNWMSGEDPDYIPMSGTHLRQTLTVAGIETPDPVVASGKYLLRLDIAEEAGALLTEERDRSRSAK